MYHIKKGSCLVFSGVVKLLLSYTGTPGLNPWLWLLTQISVMVDPEKQW